MSALICGSLAFDTIMVYPGHFKKEILPDKVHMLNVSFLVPEMRREFGGCAGNIAYSLQLLGGRGRPMGTVGRDFAPYAQWLDTHGVSRELIRELPETFTAQAYIVTDMDDNQITAFHPGAMNEAHVQDIVTDGVSLGCVSPDGREAMLLHARQFAEAGIPFIFDPGQGMPMFDGDDLRAFIEQASYVAVNDYEAELMSQRTGLSPAQIAERVRALVVTRGSKGSLIHTDGTVIEVPCAGAESLADPTGCGDAYRAGLIHGLLQGMDWPTIGRVAALMGAIKIERPGTQNHSTDPEAFAERFRREFGYALN